MLVHVDDTCTRDGTGDCRGRMPMGGPPQFVGLKGYDPGTGVAVLASGAAGDDAPGVFDFCWVVLLFDGFVSIGPALLRGGRGRSSVRGFRNVDMGWIRRCRSQDF